MNLLSNENTSWVNSFVDPVAVAKQPEFLSLDIFNQLWYVLRPSDVLNGLESRLNRASVQRSIGSRDGSNRAGKRVGECRRDVQKSGGRICQFMIGV